MHVLLTYHAYKSFFCTATAVVGGAATHRTLCAVPYDTVLYCCVVLLVQLCALRAWRVKYFATDNTSAENNSLAEVDPHPFQLPKLTFSTAPPLAAVDIRSLWWVPQYCPDAHPTKNSRRRCCSRTPSVEPKHSGAHGPAPPSSTKVCPRTAQHTGCTLTPVLHSRWLGNASSRISKPRSASPILARHPYKYHRLRHRHGRALDIKSPEEAGAFVP